MNLRQFCIVDTETTGVGPTDVPVEVAVLRLSDGALFQTLINPQRPIPLSARAVHHIRDEDVAAASTLADVGAQLTTFTAGHVLVAHNASFDARMLPMLAERTWLCTLRLARHLLPDIGHGNELLFEYFECERDGNVAHRAAADVRMTAAVLPHLLALAGARWGETSADELIAKANAPLVVKRMPFGKYRDQLIEEIPASYIQWVLKSVEDLDPDLRYTLQLAA